MVAAAVDPALRAGVELEDGPVTVDEVDVVDAAPGRSVLELSLHEGRNHVVRRMLRAGRPSGVPAWCGSRSARSGWVTSSRVAGATCSRARFRRCIAQSIYRLVAESL